MKKQILFILLFSFSLSLIPQDLMAVRARRANQTKTQEKKEDKKPMIEQSLGKLFRLQWSKLTKDDALNFATLGLTVGGLYLIFRGSSIFADLNYRNITPDDIFVVQNNTGAAERRDATWLDQEEETEIECSVCWEDFRLANRYRLGCGHAVVCGTCLRAHVRVQASEANITNIRCPQRNPNCDHVITPQEMVNIANGDQNIFDNARQAIINGPRNHALQTVPNLRACHLCPILFVYRGRPVINCPGCHAIYCAHCRRDHSGNPRDCANRDQTVIKKCPRCGTDIQKDGGCNHMRCGQCQYHFCWTCLGPYLQNGCGLGNCGILNPAPRPVRPIRRPMVFHW